MLNILAMWISDASNKTIDHAGTLAYHMPSTVLPAFCPAYFDQIAIRQSLTLENGCAHAIMLPDAFLYHFPAENKATAA